MERPILLTGIFLFCIAAVTSVDPTTRPSTTSTVRPSTTTPYWLNEIGCYVCTSSEYAQDHCSLNKFDPSSAYVETPLDCMTCKKVVTMKEGKTWTSRSCVRRGGDCISDEETICCQEERCNGDPVIGAAYGMHQTGSLVVALLALAALML